jgi:DNA polymerase-3 subunit epsilon
MMWNLIKHKKKEDLRPEFWKEYLNSFKNEIPQNLEELRFIVLDTETTGFSQQKDRILSIGCVSLLNNKIEVTANFEVYLMQSIFKAETVKIHGLLRGGEIDKINELEALKQFLLYIKNNILVAHHASFDIGMIDEALIRNGLGRLQNKFLDTGILYKRSKHMLYQEHLKKYSLDELCEILKVEKTDRHTAIGDALITAIIFQKIVSRIFLKKDFDLKKLFK